MLAFSAPRSPHIDCAEASSALLRPGSAKALSTVTAIIDGMGSCGAALGPLLTGHLAALPGGFDNVFYMLYAASAAAAALLACLVVREVGPPRSITRVSLLLLLHLWFRSVGSPLAGHLTASLSL